MFLRGFLTLLICFSLTFISPLTSADSECDALPFVWVANHFSENIATSIDREYKNFFLSPLSIFMTLAMTYLGARGSTAIELEKAFFVRGNLSEEFHSFFQDIMELYDINSEDYAMSVDNGLLLQKNYSFNQSYVERVKKFYKGQVTNLGFSKDEQAAPKFINTWVNVKTKDSKSIAMSLLNAMEFKAPWKFQFNKSKTHNADFYIGIYRYPTPTMRALGVTLPFFDDDKKNFKFLELPYKGQDIVMMIALPRKYSGYTPRLNMDTGTLCRINKNLRMTTFSSVQIPKFRIQQTEELNETLSRVKLREIFTSSADLSGIDKKYFLRLSSVLHKAVINVDEEGGSTPEAKVTAGSKPDFITDREMGSLSFVADRPFLFYIIDKRNFLILFVGCAYNPSTFRPPSY